MKTLIVPQHSELDKAISEGRTQEKGHTVWKDTGLPIQYPISVTEGNQRGVRWIPGKVTHSVTFESLCERFPNNVRIAMSSTPKASWGMGIYCADSDGFPVLLDSEWDTSD